MSTCPAAPQERLAESSALRPMPKRTWQPHSLLNWQPVHFRPEHWPPAGAFRRHSRQDRTSTPAAPLSLTLSFPQLFAMRACVETPTSMAGCPAVESLNSSTSSRDGEPSRVLRPRETIAARTMLTGLISLLFEFSSRQWPHSGDHEAIVPAVQTHRQLQRSQG